jgi:hypothetical protein
MSELDVNTSSFRKHGWPRRQPPRGALLPALAGTPMRAHRALHHGRQLRHEAALVRRDLRVGPPRLHARRKLLGLAVEVGPLGDDAARGAQLGLLGQRVVAEVDRLRGRARGGAAPGLAPEPLARQRVDRHRVLRVVGQVLVEVGERVGVAREAVVDDAQPVARGGLPEALQVNDVAAGGRVVGC